MRDDPLNRTKVLRGSALPHAKLTESDVAKIHEIVATRKELMRQALVLMRDARSLSNKRIAQSVGLHVRTIDKITAGYSWTHVADWQD